MASSDMIKLTSSDGKEFNVPVKVIQCSEILKTFVDNFGDHSEAIPLPNVTAAILEKVLTWAEHHKDDLPETEQPKANNEAYALQVIGTWDADFLKVDHGTLFELILAANYLDIRPLLNLTCICVRDMIMGKTPQEIRELFNITNSPEEEIQVCKEND